ncbi:MAG: DUF4294 domain-containing protein, partial [Bacteroidales bacterium]|nr:DUF4294 domain-containing protein [Bacteroidales bacterium]
MKKLVFLPKTNRTMRVIFTIISIMICAQLAAQNTSEVVRLGTRAVVVDGDTMPINRIQTAYVFPPLQFKNKKEEREYTRMMRDVKKMYPYSQLAKATLANIK